MIDSKGNQPEDCLLCRLVTGFGVLAVGGYLYAQSQRRGGIQMQIMRAMAAGVGCLGIARLLNVEFLKANKGKR